jgi:hypothetical protein
MVCHVHISGAATWSKRVIAAGKNGVREGEKNGQTPNYRNPAKDGLGGFN